MASEALSDEPPDEPQHLCCPITHALFRDPVFVPESGTTYERSAIHEFWAQSGERRDALTNVPIQSDMLYTNWGKRREVANWLGDHSEYIPQGWRSRDDVPPAQPRPEHRQRQLPQFARFRFPSLKACAMSIAIGASIGSGFGITPDVIVDITVGTQRKPGQRNGTSCEASKYGFLNGQKPSDHGISTAMMLLGIDGNSASRRPPVPALAMLGAMPRRLQVSVLRSPESEASAVANDGLLSKEEHAADKWSRHSTFATTHGLRVDVPYGSATRVVSADNLAGLFFAGFTTIWTRGVWRANAPILFTLFSCPFWHASASLLAASLKGVFHRSTLTVHQEGIQLERQGSLFGDVGGVLADHDVLHSTSCTLVPWTELESASLEDALHVRVTHVVNGDEVGLLEVRTAWGTAVWASGDLTIDELRAVRDTLLLWVRERGVLASRGRRRR